MTELSEKLRICDVLTMEVLDSNFRNVMACVAAAKSFACVIYNGNLYDFEYYSNAVGGNFRAGVTTLKNGAGSGDLLSILLSHYLSTRPSYRLFAHNFVSLDDPFPSIGPVPAEDLRTFVGRCPSMPLNLLIAEGEKFETIGRAAVAIADISDGDAWLFVIGEG